MALAFICIQQEQRRPEDTTLGASDKHSSPPSFVKSPSSKLSIHQNYKKVFGVLAEMEGWIWVKTRREINKNRRHTKYLDLYKNCILK